MSQSYSQIQCNSLLFLVSGLIYNSDNKTKLESDLKSLHLLHIHLGLTAFDVVFVFIQYDLGFAPSSHHGSLFCAINCKKNSISKNMVTPRSTQHAICCAVYSSFVVGNSILKQQQQQQPDIVENRETLTRTHAMCLLFLFVLHLLFPIKMWCINAP